MESPTITNAKGGNQSQLLSYDEFMLQIIPRLRQVLERANHKYDKSPYEQPNWHLIPVQDHLNHAMAHLMRFQQHEFVGIGHQDAGDYNEDDLINAAIRCMFAWYLHNGLDADVKGNHAVDDEGDDSQNGESEYTYLARYCITENKHAYHLTYYKYSVEEALNQSDRPGWVEDSNGKILAVKMPNNEDYETSDDCLFRLTMKYGDGTVVRRYNIRYSDPVCYSEFGLEDRDQYNDQYGGLESVEMDCMLYGGTNQLKWFYTSGNLSQNG